MEIEEDDFNDEKKLKKICKKMLNGETCKLVCFIVKKENNLGRSIVIDLNKNKKFAFK